MDNNHGINQLAQLFKERENKIYLGPQIGKVLTPPPGIKISLGDKIILDKERLIIASHVLNEYEREVEINGDIEISGGIGLTTLVQPPPPETPTTSQTWGMTSTSLNGQETITGKMKYTDTLKPGDEVILIPSNDNQIYFLIDKVVRL